MGGCRWYVVKFIEGQLGLGLKRLEGVIIVYNKVSVAESSHHGSPGGLPRRVECRQQKQIPIGQYVTVSQRAKLINRIL